MNFLNIFYTCNTTVTVYLKRHRRDNGIILLILYGNWFLLYTIIEYFAMSTFQYFHCELFVNHCHFILYLQAHNKSIEQLIKPVYRKSICTRALSANWSGLARDSWPSLARKFLTNWLTRLFSLIFEMHCKLVLLKQFTLTVVTMSLQFINYWTVINILCAFFPPNNSDLHSVP